MVRGVPFLDVTGAVGWIAADGAERIISELTDALAEDFRRWGEFHLTPRLASHSRDGVIELMPTSDGQQYAFKYVNGHPINPSRGLQTVTAFGVLADVATGYPVFVAEMTLLTALRTAATSALAARVLARADSRVMAMIGTGSQAEFQAIGMRAELGIERLRVFDTDPASTAKFVRNATALGFEVVVCDDPRAAALGADVVTTCTADKAYATVLPADAVVPGMHLNAIGGDCPGKTELDASVLDRARVVVEHTPQTRIEGELQQMHDGFAVTELHEVLTGAAAGRTSADQITLFDSVGFAVEDFTALRHAYARVAGSGLVRHLDLVASPADPKDLWALVAGGAAAPVDAELSVLDGPR
ncbi:MAG: ornithine cyclodeaminase [Nocardioides sp.]|uniref:ornithine cyclodeaminase n=1 Tax=Nocardioides sp. TaxID=35761 RepID=UPI003F0A3467